MSIIVNGQVKNWNVCAQTTSETLKLVENMYEILLLKIYQLFIKNAQNFGYEVEKPVTLKLKIKVSCCHLHDEVNKRVRKLLRENNSIEKRKNIIYRIEIVFTEMFEYCKKKILECFNLEDMELKFVLSILQKLNDYVDEKKRPQNSIFIKTLSLEEPKESSSLEELEKKVNNKIAENQTKYKVQTNEIQLLLEQLENLNKEISELENQMKPLNQKKNKNKKMTPQQKNKLAELQRKKSDLCQQRHDKEKEKENLVISNQRLDITNRLIIKLSS